MVRESVRKAVACGGRRDSTDRYELPEMARGMMNLALVP